MSIIWHNGTFRTDQPVFMAHDRLRLGDGVFDTMLAVDGKIIAAEEHCERLKRHAGVFNIHVDTNPLIMAASELLKKNDLLSDHAVINTIITRGPANRGLKTPNNPDIQIVMRASYVPTDMPPPRLIIARSVRRNEGSPLSQIKSVNYGDSILARIEADNAGANDAIFLNNAGHVTCATGSNVFITQAGKLYTPPLSDGVMDGIIRAKIIRMYGAIEQSLTSADIEAADGLYLTNSVGGARAAESLNGRAFSLPSLRIDNDIHLR